MKDELTQVKHELKKLSEIFDLLQSSMVDAVDKMEKLDKIEDFTKQKLEIDKARKKLEKLNQNQ